MLAIKGVAKRAGMNTKELGRFLRFAFVGVIGAVVDFGSLNYLYFATMVAWLGDSNGKLMAQGLSFVTAICSNFIWNRYWTYPDSRSKPLGRQFSQFFLVNLTGILPRTLIVWLTTGLFTNLAVMFNPTAIANDRIGLNLAVALSVGIVMFWNFFANRYWTYNDID